MFHGLVFSGIEMAFTSIEMAVCWLEYMLEHIQTNLQRHQTTPTSVQLWKWHKMFTE